MIHYVSLGVLWLDVKVDKKKTYFSFNVMFFIPENKISNSVEVLLVLNLFHYLFF